MGQVFLPLSYLTYIALSTEDSCMINIVPKLSTEDNNCIMNIITQLSNEEIKIAMTL